MKKKVIDIQEILKDLENGLTRLKKEDRGKGNIQEKYDLSPNEIKELFKNPKLMYKRTHTVGEGLSFIVVDSSEEGITPTVKEEIVVVNDRSFNLVTVNLDGDREVGESGEELLMRTQREVENIISKNDLV